jgi:hypothetical protein
MSRTEAYTMRSGAFCGMTARVASPASPPAMKQMRGGDLAGARFLSSLKKDRISIEPSSKHGRENENEREQDTARRAARTRTRRGRAAHQLRAGSDEFGGGGA